MRVLIAINAVEIALKVVDATDTHFPWVEDTVTHLWCEGKVKVIARHSKTEVATIDELPFQIRDIRKKLCRGLFAESHQHKTQ